MAKNLFILNDGPYGTERSYNALRLAGALAKREGEEVRPPGGPFILILTSTLNMGTGQACPQRLPAPRSVPTYTSSVLGANVDIAAG